ncbi:unnamed protein product [Pieris macdunnoughi]|uniref:Uncharacterized protein n=1 Tax=Pieris macdunnoughi TaxID=345717 RepID=A0A821XW31_9NEOP|nr:unnamed protein product [Pieris macdunnoughi]
MLMIQDSEEIKSQQRLVNLLLEPIQVLFLARHFVVGWNFKNLTTPAVREQHNSLSQIREAANCIYSATLVSGFFLVSDVSRTNEAAFVVQRRGQAAATSRTPRLHKTSLSLHGISI